MTWKRLVGFTLSASALLVLFTYLLIGCASVRQVPGTLSESGRYTAQIPMPFPVFDWVTARNEEFSLRIGDRHQGTIHTFRFDAPSSSVAYFGWSKGECPSLF
jgi:hypothetical protein